MIPVLAGRADMHMHTTESDGRATVVQMLDFAARQRQLDVLAITDHDRLDASLWAASQQGRYPFDIVPGVEVTSRDGHVLALWVSKPIPSHLSLKETVAAIHEQAGVAVLAHPFELFIAPRAVLHYIHRLQRVLDSGVDAVEAFNAGAITPGGNIATRLRMGHLPLAMMGGSDAHMAASIGSGMTRFHGHSADDLRRSIAQGWTRAEGQRWQIIDYWKLCRNSPPKRRSASSPMKAVSNPQTLP
ncbi:MAG TPA: PHP-associated domain-containing protein [Candidatus Limnocylindrales bacterium]|nr:PHP-associated domain-containing protein [Candidatus Limnocylindrales bacterium]